MANPTKKKNATTSYGAVDSGNNGSAGSEGVVVVAAAATGGDEEKPLLLTSMSSSLSLPAASEHSVVGIMCIMLGAFSFSIMFLLVKLMQGTANAFTMVFYRALVQIAISAGTIAYHGTENPFGPADDNYRTRTWLCVRGGFGGMAVLAWFFGIQHLPLPDAVTLQFTTPPFAAAFAVCLVHERWLPLDMVGAVVCLAGVALIAHPTWLFGSIAEDEEGEDTDGDADGGSSSNAVLMKALAVAITTLGAAMAGLAYVSVRLIGDRASPVVMVLYYAVLSIPMAVLGTYWLEGTWSVWAASQGSSFTAADYVLMVLTGLAGYGGQFFTNLGLQKETAATVRVTVHSESITHFCAIAICCD